MSVPEKIKLARVTLPGRPTQAQMGALLRMKEEQYQSYELGRVKGPGKVEAFVERAAKVHGIPFDWFYDGTVSAPPRSSDPTREIKVPVYHAPPAMALVTKEERVEMISIDADIALEMKSSKGVELPDERMSPRFKPFTRLFGKPVERLKIDRMYIAERRPKEPTDTENEIIIGVYRVIGQTFVLAPINDKFDPVNVLDLRDFKLIFAAQEVVDGDPDWVLNEKRIKNGLPVHSPK